MNVLTRRHTAGGMHMPWARSKRRGASREKTFFSETKQTFSENF
jgi:hypothetical protein